MKVKINDLRKNIETLLQANLNEDEAKRVADYLIWAEMSDVKTQGIIKLSGSKPLQGIKPQYQPRIERETKLSQLIDAGGCPSALVSQIATDVVIKKAKESGFAVVGVHNIFSSNGAQAYYVERMARENLIGIMMSRSPASVAAFGGIDPVFGTNPVGFAFPTKDKPLVFDMATSAMTFYGLILAKMRGEKIPDNIAIDADGTPTNDPSAAMDGAILPFDRGYKGAGLGMVVEIMTGPLVASAFCDNKTYEEQWGSVFIAIQPDLLVDIDKFKSDCSELIECIKNSRKKNESDMIRLPGEHAREAYEQCEASGEVEVDDELLKEIGMH